MYDLIDKAVEEFKSLNNKPIRVISHLDCDGITSASIMAKTLTRENKKFILSIVKQLNENILKELALENYNTIIFTDLGSGYISLINKYLKSKKVFIFDHHSPEDNKDYENIVHINPHLSKIKESYNMPSGAGIVYLFSKSLNKNNIDLAHLALIGAIGDVQDIKNINKEILEDSISTGKILIKYGLKMFGSQTKPLNKILQYNTDIYIPGVTGSEEGTFNFLSNLGINYMENGKIKRIVDLNDEELKKLTTSIIIRRLGSEHNPEDVFGNIYILKEEVDDNLKDAREFSTLLNCCGRLNKPSIGIGVCLDNSFLKQKALELLKQYKLELIHSLNWFYANKEKLIQNEKFVIVNTENNVRDTLVGTLISIVSRSSVYKDKTILIGMAYTLDNNIKISVRACNNFDGDLTEVLTKIVNGNGEVGGHKQACGALIPMEKEMEFIEKAKEILNRKVY